MFYVLDNNNNKVEALDKEGVLNAINTAIQDGSLNNLVADAAFISKLKCCVSGVTNKVAFVTQGKYNELFTSGALVENCYYYITDDNTYSDIVEKLDEIINQVNGNTTQINNITASTFKAPYAGEADKAQGIIKKALTYENIGTDIKRVYREDPKRIIGGLASKTYLVNLLIESDTSCNDTVNSLIFTNSIKRFTVSFMINPYNSDAANTYSQTVGSLDALGFEIYFNIEVKKYNGVLNGLYLEAYTFSGGTFYTANSIKVLNAVAIPID